MPDRLARIWKGPGGGQPGAAASEFEAPLDVWIGRFLLHAEPLIYQDRGQDFDARRWAPLAEQLEAIADDHILPALDRMSNALGDEFHKVANWATISMLVLAGMGLLAALLNVVAIFRPMARTVLANQSALIAERDKAVAADMAKRNFLTVVSHELRTPMNGILGFASLLLGSELKPEHRKQVEIIHSSGKALLALVNDILDFSKLEAGSLQLEQEAFSIEEAVSGVVTLLRGGAAAKGLEFSVFIDPRLPISARGDANRLRQVLTNLVGNAIKFTDTGGLAVEAHEVSGNTDPAAGCELQLVVIDTGIGIPADQHEAVFERFAQVDSSTRRKREGSGLGLAICRELVERMGGRIWVESTPGVGSTFFVRLPFAAAQAEPGEPDARRTATAGLAGRRALVIDRCALSRRIARLQLEAYGLKVDEASGPEQGQSLLEQAAAAKAPYAVAIVDELGPAAEGLEFARRLRADRRFAQVALILNVSAGNRDMEQAQGLDEVAVQVKPVLPRALVETLRALAGAEPATPDRNRVSLARVLLIDDRQIAQQISQSMLVDANYEVDVVGDAAEAMRATSSGGYDLILFDLRFPVTEAMKTVRRLKARKGPAGQIPVVALVPPTGEEKAPDYSGAGIELAIEKPADPERLLTGLKQIVDARRQRAAEAANDTDGPVHLENLKVAAGE